MNTIIVVCVLISLSVSAPISEDAEAKILRYVNENDGQGSYEFSFETSNGIERKETGRLVYAGQPDEHIEVRGFYSYMDSEGKLVIVKYVADDKGYHTDEDVPGIKLDNFPLDITPISLPAAAVATLLG